MRAGKLNKRVTVQRNAGTTQDAAGQPVESWTTVATRWATVEQLGGGEPFQGEQHHGRGEWRVTMRYLSGVRPKMRVLYGSRVLDIHTVRDVDERRTTTEILATERDV